MNPLNELGQTGEMPIVKQFAEFKKMIGNRNPQEVLNELIKSGKVNQEQYNKAIQLANQFRDILK